MAGVEADGHSRVVDRGKHLRDLLELRAHASAETGVVLDEQVRGARVRALEHVVQVLDDRRQPRLEAGALVRPRVKDDAVDAQVVGRLTAQKNRIAAMPKG